MRLYLQQARTQKEIIFPTKQEYNLLCFIKTEASFSPASRQLHFFLTIHFLPPAAIILQPLGEPGEDGILPL